WEYLNTKIRPPSEPPGLCGQGGPPAPRTWRRPPAPPPRVKTWAPGPEDAPPVLPRRLEQGHPSPAGVGAPDCYPVEPGRRTTCPVGIVDRGHGITSGDRCSRFVAEAMETLRNCCNLCKVWNGASGETARFFWLFRYLRA